MNQRLLEPIKYYDTEGKATHRKNTEAYFDKLVASSGINLEENRKTVGEYKAEMDKISLLDKKISRNKTAKVFLIIGIILSAIAIGISFALFGNNLGAGFITLGVGVAILVICILILIKKVNPVLKSARELRDLSQEKANELRERAEKQMVPLNALFDERDTITLMETTLPEINFEDTYTKEQEELFIKHYDFIDLESEECSMTQALSGKFEGNPFLFCRCLMHELKNVTYHGSLVISWTETYRDKDGNSRTRRRTQTLHASVTKPKPFYHYNNYLAYGSQAAPSLTFSRAPQVKAGMDEKDIDKKVRKGERKLKKKAEKAMKKGGHFQEMANAEFDVLFGAANRSNEVEFRLMYTPLAQKNTVDLVTSKSGYGDDFYFTKHKKFNIITTNHSQSWDMNTSPSNYFSYDVDEAKRKFVDFNMSFFKTVFFDFAPLLSVPAYLEEPCKSLETPEAYLSNYPYYEHEAIANAFDIKRFLPDFSIEQGILKTHIIEKRDKEDIIGVTAYSYTTMEHIDYVPVLGGDGRMHGVPVCWTEYLPTEKTTSVSVSGTGMSRKEFDRRKGMETAFFECELLHGLIGKIL
ncbi:MAG: hypothetical protein IJX51_07605 [Clostridia bacterium]|nr:hypothetical protein [Clostridia bacterium]